VGFLQHPKQTRLQEQRQRRSKETIALQTTPSLVEKTDTQELTQNLKGSILSASLAQSSFEEATLDLEQAQYKIALQKFKLIEQSGFYSGGLFLNMAIAAVELDSLGLAKFYLQKAVEEPTTEAAAIEALAYVESQFSRQAATLPPLPWETALDYIEHHWGSLWLFWSAFSFLSLSVVLLLFHWFGNAPNRSKKSSAKAAYTYDNERLLDVLTLLFYQFKFGHCYRLPLCKVQ
jgi:hypothetical protein